MIDKKFSPEFRIRIEDDGWATIWDDTGFIELAPDEMDNLRKFLAEGPVSEANRNIPPVTSLLPTPTPPKGQP